MSLLLRWLEALVVERVVGRVGIVTWKSNYDMSSIKDCSAGFVVASLSSLPSTSTLRLVCWVRSNLERYSVCFFPFDRINGSSLHTGYVVASCIRGVGGITALITLRNELYLEGPSTTRNLEDVIDCTTVYPWESDEERVERTTGIDCWLPPYT